MKYGIWFLGLKEQMPLVKNGSIRINMMKRELSPEIRPNLWLKDTLKEVDFDETFSPVARLESIKLLL